MKIHPPLLTAIAQCLEQIFAEGYYADKVIERAFKANKKWGVRDRKFIAENVYEIVRWWRFIWVVIDEPVDLSEYALKKLALTYFYISKKELEVNAFVDAFRLDERKIKNIIENKNFTDAETHSVTEWLYDLGKKELGNRWNPILEALNLQAPVIIRTNTLRTTPEALKAKLIAEEFEVQTLKNPPGALKLLHRKNIFLSEAFKLGHFEIQDGSSQMIAPLLDLKPGLRVIDACAGAGGKTLHAAALMKNKGRIIALDIHEKKLAELKKRSARAGCDVIEMKLIEGSKTIKRLEATADRLLLDVPCSGLGALRRNPDSKWKLSLERVEELRQIQADILQTYTPMVKPGGLVLYATCSILPSENELQVKNFLANNKNYKLESEKHFWPGENDFDGFYAAQIRRLT